MHSDGLFWDDVKGRAGEERGCDGLGLWIEVAGDEGFGDGESKLKLRLVTGRS